MVDRRVILAAFLVLLIIGLMACSVPPPRVTQLWADVSEPERMACIEDVSVLSDLGGADLRVRPDIRNEAVPVIWVIQRCTGLQGIASREVSQDHETNAGVL